MTTSPSTAYATTVRRGFLEPGRHHDVRISIIKWSWALVLYKATPIYLSPRHPTSWIIQDKSLLSCPRACQAVWAGG
jgi:hypothetical protein